mmetsp:Transcript_49800/g.50633  ORF Transcript_49800/g.50633 Transcript_49800/m.50633 type:complete len:81 (-) Transcript_49800:68-310(-)
MDVVIDDRLHNREKEVENKTTNEAGKAHNKQDAKARHTIGKRTKLASLLPSLLLIITSMVTPNQSLQHHFVVTMRYDQEE